MIRYNSTTNHWFVSVKTPKHMRFSRHARETKSFPTEIEAKRFAKAMLSEGRKVTAGTLSPHQPIRRTVTASEIDQWIKEEKKRARDPNC
jgi:wyosine [tRNA(Phe)-imidazoG37] synthetase (radical SAM superfamily)